MLGKARSNHAGAVVAMVIAFVGGACSSTAERPQASQGSTATTAPRTIARGTKGVPTEVIDGQTDWPLPGQDYDNSRTARASRVSSVNVNTLKKAWVAAPDGLVSLSTAPIVIGDTMFVEGGTGRVAAIDRVTGTTRWISAATGFNAGPFGVAVADGRVFAVDGSSGVLALDEQTGTVLWKHRLTTTDSLGVDIQPTVFGGMVFASTVPVSLKGIYAPGDRGTIYALDARTGTPRWSFDTVRGDLWGHPEINSGGGAWYPPAIDITRRIIYFGTGNPAPFPGTAKYPNGASRPGPNLYTDSVVALDVDDGHLIWYHQVTAHDIFDRDQVHVMLARTTRGRDVVISAGKSGEVLALDRDSGAVLWTRAVGKHQHDDGPLPHGGTAVYPGTYGGVLTPPAVAGGVAYVAVLNAPATLQPNSPAYIGGELGRDKGEVVAIDVDDGRIRWDTKVPGDPLGGATVVNDLVFTALFDGTVVALRRDTGRIVWHYQTGGGINGWLSATADTLFVPVGLSNPPQIVALRLPRS